MGKINKAKTAFRWSGTAKNLKTLLKLQRYLLIGERYKPKAERLTLTQFLTKVYQ